MSNAKKKTAGAIAASKEATPATPQPGSEPAPPLTREQKIATLALGPIGSTSVTAAAYAKQQAGPIDSGAAFHALVASIKGVRGADMCEPGDFLMAQAVALNAIFNALAMRSQVQQRMENLDPFMRLALKAQNQCRMTLETLAAIKNPPVVFARQANVANGPQQVNNVSVPGPTTHTTKPQNLETELLETHHGKRLDTRTKSQASSADPRMETVGVVHRAAHG